MGGEKDKGKDKSEKDKKEKGDKGKKDKKDNKNKDPKSKEKVEAKIFALERKLDTLKQSISGDVRLQDKVLIHFEGVDLRCDKDVRVRVGPVIGKVSSTTAVVLVEVTLSAQVTCHLIPQGGATGKIPSRNTKLLLPKNKPKAFLIEGLIPNTKRVCKKAFLNSKEQPDQFISVANGVNAKDSRKRTGAVHTMPENPHNLRVVALSCDRPERLKPGETNMWELLADQIKNDEVDVVLHLGDQVYGQDEFIDAQAIFRYSNPVANPTTPEEKKEVHRLYKRIKDRMRDIYRHTWNLPHTQYVLSHSSHLMIWSDNDLYNDFTVAKEDGKGLEPIMIKLGQEVYREYQRQLWDPLHDPDTCTSTDEFHYHKFGPIGILMLDMRGNRIDFDGTQRPTNPLLNHHQWASIDSALIDPSVKILIVSSEIPFAGDPPEVCQKNALKPDLEFLVDHWAYNEAELVKLFEKIFDWKHEGNGEREAIFVAGGIFTVNTLKRVFETFDETVDIHVGVDSIISDLKNNITIQQLVATPISNHVCKFFPKLEGKVNDRFTYVHTPLDLCRNYGCI